MKLGCTVLLISLSAASAHAAVIETSTRCDAGEYQLTNPTSCYASYGSAEAEAYSEIKKPSDVSEIEVKVKAGAYSHGDHSAYAQAHALVRAWILPKGPVREGWINLYFNFDDVVDTYGGGINAIVGPYSRGLYGGIENGRYPILLGIPFLVQLSAGASSEAPASPETITGHYFSGVGEMRFSLSENNGNFVEWDEWNELSSVPEPGSISIGGLCALFLLYVGRRIR